MLNLLIIGARGFGREIYYLSTESLGFGTEFVVKGFLDDKKDALDDYKNYPPIISSVEDYSIQEDDVFICALGDVKYKKKYGDIIKSKGGNFMNLIHKSVSIGLNSVYGTGCIFTQNVNISCDVTIGNDVTIQPFSEIGHDSIIGNNCHLNTYSFMGGFSKIGDNVTINTGAILLPHKKVLDGGTIGAGSVAIRNVKNDTTVFGLPAVEI
jgi:sugar O-acyltransferase (sialic acid O-acetyltransferase NeuD family)